MKTGKATKATSINLINRLSKWADVTNYLEVVTSEEKDVAMIA